MLANAYFKEQKSFESNRPDQVYHKLRSEKNTKWKEMDFHQTLEMYLIRHSPISLQQVGPFDGSLNLILIHSILKLFIGAIQILDHRTLFSQE